jgi:hypothetical protein
MEAGVIASLPALLSLDGSPSSWFFSYSWLGSASVVIWTGGHEIWTEAERPPILGSPTPGCANHTGRSSGLALADTAGYSDVYFHFCGTALAILYLSRRRKSVSTQSSKFIYVSKQSLLCYTHCNHSNPLSLLRKHTIYPE